MQGARKGHLNLYPSLAASEGSHWQPSSSQEASKFMFFLAAPKGVQFAGSIQIYVLFRPHRKGSHCKECSLQRASKLMSLFCPQWAATAGTEASNLAPLRPQPRTPLQLCETRLFDFSTLRSTFRLFDFSGSIFQISSWSSNQVVPALKKQRCPEMMCAPGARTPFWTPQRQRVSIARFAVGVRFCFYYGQRDYHYDWNRAMALGLALGCSPCIVLQLLLYCAVLHFTGPVRLSRNTCFCSVSTTTCRKRF